MHNPTTKLASFLSKERRLSQAYLELSSSRGVFGSRESERKKRERRERREKRKKRKTKPKIKYFIYKNKNLQKVLPNCCFTKKILSLLQKERGLYRPPQGMKIPKTLRTWLSYRTIK